ncbi:hypothetical protein LXL04_025970 [Taraxacum kok-saghyz]
MEMEMEKTEIEKGKERDKKLEQMSGKKERCGPRTNRRVRKIWSEMAEVVEKVKVDFYGLNQISLSKHIDLRGCLICTDRVRHQTTDRVRHQNTDQTPRTDIRPRTESEITGKNSVCDFFGRTESEAKRRTESGVRVRRPLSNAQTTDRVRGPSLSLWSELISNTP